MKTSRGITRAEPVRFYLFFGEPATELMKRHVIDKSHRLSAGCWKTCRGHKAQGRRRSNENEQVSLLVNSPNTFAVRVCLLFGAGVFFAVSATCQLMPRDD